MTAQPRPLIRDLDIDNIADLATRASALPDVLTLWYGEGDLVTPAFVREAAKAALDAGQTFYVPDMRGTDLVRALRATERHASVRGLAHASYVLPGDVDRSFDAGCDAFMEHPFPPGSLERAIAALFTR